MASFPVLLPVEGVVLTSGHLLQLWLPFKGAAIPSGQLAILVMGVVLPKD